MIWLGITIVVLAGVYLGYWRACLRDEGKYIKLDKLDLIGGTAFLIMAAVAITMILLGTNFIEPEQKLLILGFITVKLAVAGCFGYGLGYLKRLKDQGAV